MDSSRREQEQQRRQAYAFAVAKQQQQHEHGRNEQRNKDELAREYRFAESRHIVQNAIKVNKSTRIHLVEIGKTSYNNNNIE
jgi:hypothetical protein